MSVPFRIFALAIALCFGVSLVAAHSSPPRPLKRVAHPSTHLLEILPRHPSPSGTYAKRSYPIDSPELRHTDSFRLTLSAFDDTFHLHLRPNEHLIHPAARVNYYRTGPDGHAILSHTEPLLPESVKAYWGEVIPADLSTGRMREDAAGVWPRPSGKSELGWARITVHHQGDVSQGIPPRYEGAFSVNGVVHHVMTQENYLRNKHHMDPHVILLEPEASLVIFRDSDVMSPDEYHIASGGLDTGVPARTCAHDTLPYNTDPLRNPALRKPFAPPVTPWYDPLDFLGANMTKRSDVAGGGVGSNFVNNIGQSAGCPSTQKVVYMGVAADCVYTSQAGSPANASQQIITNFNTASALYKTTFNVSLGIVELQVHDANCPNTTDPTAPWNIACQDSVTLNDRLSLFSAWRGQKGNDGAGLWHLMSGCPTGSEVGIAWLATLCQQTASGDPGSVVSGTAVSTSGRVEWQVISHEIGHNFGAIHDCTDGCQSDSSQCCPLSSSTCDANSQFIMSPVAQSSEMKFSACTLGNICSLMLGNTGGKTNTTCLADPGTGKQTISLQMCGNGIVEPGEECDPGLGSNSTCCNASTCKLNAGAVCDPQSSPCCTGQCSFAPSTQVCRVAKDPSCDTAEMCTGNSSACPADKFSPNGQSCGSNGLACANGFCTSLDKQCQTVGASMNLQKACPSKDDKSCQVSCQDPTTSNQCVVLQSVLIDGSPCGYGGTCISGNCKPGSALDTAKAWYVQNLQISIPVTVVVGIIVLLLLWSLFSALRRCCGSSPPPRRKFVPAAEPAFRGVGGQRLGSWPDQINNADMRAVAANGVSPYATLDPNAPRHSRGHSGGQYAPQYSLKPAQASRFSS